MNTLKSKRHMCSLCDRTYSRNHDLKRHIQLVHAEEKASSESDESSDKELSTPNPVLRAVLAKKNLQIESESDESSEVSESEEEDDDDKEAEVELEDNPVFQDWLDQAMEATDDMRKEKYEKYVNEGMSEEEAKERAHDKVIWTVKKNFFDQYAIYLWQTIHLEDDETNQGILVEVQEKMEKGVIDRKAIRKVLAKHKTYFDELFLYESDDEDDEDDSEGEEEMDGVVGDV